ncbi:MAG TPA: hypothetical protein VMF91_25755 [Bryobacteraceae bacterium]|nr:hypothetical protein [Bryobacteraceae bacterium]
MAVKVCTVKGVDPRGLPKTVIVEARSLLEAAAAGFEKLHHDGGCRYAALEITVHEPGRTFQVGLSQLVQWLTRRQSGETVGVTALKRRVQDVIRTMPKSPKSVRYEKEP